MGLYSVGPANDNDTFTAGLQEKMIDVTMYEAFTSWLAGNEVTLHDNLPPDPSLATCPPVDGASIDTPLR